MFSEIIHFFIIFHTLIQVCLLVYDLHFIAVKAAGPAFAFYQITAGFYE
jgi:hypothetical protein